MGSAPQRRVPMTRISALAVACVAALMLSTSSARASSITVGQWDSGNCYPFSCLASDGGSTYQQVYASSQFAAAGYITAISFYQDPNFPGLMDSATYNVSFSTTSASV